MGIPKTLPRPWLLPTQHCMKFPEGHLGKSLYWSTCWDAYSPSQHGLFVLHSFTGSSTQDAWNLTKVTARTQGSDFLFAPGSYFRQEKQKRSKSHYSNILPISISFLHPLLLFSKLSSFFLLFKEYSLQKTKAKIVVFPVYSNLLWVKEAPNFGFSYNKEGVKHKEKKA